MKNDLVTISLIGCLGLAVLMSCGQSQSSNVENLQPEFSNLFDLWGMPNNVKDRSVFSFSDLGAWHSYSLSPKPSGGFVGPYLMTDDNGIWASQQLVTLQLSLGGLALDWSSAKMIESLYLPGRLIQTYQLEGITIKQELIFISNRSTLVQYQIESNAKQPKVVADLKAATWLSGWSFSVDNDQLLLQSDSSKTKVLLTFDQPADGVIEANSFVGQEQEFDLNPNFPVKISYVQSTYFTESERRDDKEAIDKALVNPVWAFANNQKRWNDYLTKTLEKTDGQAIDSVYKDVAVKSLNTLINNWRSAAGELKHDGLFPSYAYGGFHGFWAWDSWKHSVGLADILPQLAKDQILTMYDYQDIDGMIADCIFRDTLIEKHNWRDTKPPLSGWAIAKVFETTQDTIFIKQLYPKLKKYHQWWYDFRDHDQNGLCEYGSTDGTRVAAAWESGMDNAVRFDEATMLTNGGGGYSLDQESVDLNAYLYAEKLYLVQLAQILGETSDAERYRQEALGLAEQIKEQFYDSGKGFFFDVMLDDKVIQIFGPEGWIPLWAGLATEEQAAAVANHIMDQSQFNTKVPLPTLDASHPKFNPKNGYWRGPVWLDQVYFAIRGLEKYGYHQEANELKNKLFNNAEGLMTDGPIRENYHPITGEGLNAKHFSWSAAHLLMLIRE
ncbi:MAG: trehalase family glycosidase [Reichenbachiella sp.]|uniref:MGH1-like glycoside hydrolase domain-containing protein n=1 Tax=Reichenbachiella sp. TaxID=2184521 RepID=UPI0029668FF7|nr:trehalase family glycosidase [Reichenbachiella sp.]MDW3211457.1 trehalase family glycosidase [Reichenbachiella sp.]